MPRLTKSFGAGQNARWFLNQSNKWLNYRGEKYTKEDALSLSQSYYKSALRLLKQINNPSGGLIKLKEKMYHLLARRLNDL